jgi:hypothetical protein
MFAIGAATTGTLSPNRSVSQLPIASLRRADAIRVVPARRQR